MHPVPYSEPRTLQMSDKVHWATGSLENIRDELPPGAQRYRRTEEQTEHLK